MSNTRRKDVLNDCYRNGEGIYSQNTPLHDAIHANDTALALQCIEEDMLANDGRTVINRKAHMNTPLIFSIKKGNAEVAEAILNHPYVDVNATEGRGLTALHWACMLRLNRIITLLLENEAETNCIADQTNWGTSEISELEEITPYNLYCRDVILFNFQRYCDAYLEAQGIQNRNEPDYNFYKRYSTFNNFFSADRSVLSAGRITIIEIYAFHEHKLACIPGEMAYTDVVFHLADICQNLNWKASNTIFDTLATQHSGQNKYLKSSEIFFNNFIAGIADFCQHRNAIPIDRSLAMKLKPLEIKPQLQRPLGPR